MRFYCAMGDGWVDQDGEPVPGIVWQEGEDVAVPANATLMCEWDGTSDGVTIIFGEIPPVGIPFLGWPQMAI